jgi:hypothetical protein
MNFFKRNHNHHKNSTFFVSRKPLFLIVLLISLSITIQAQTVHVVDNNQGAGAQYTSVQTAVNAATAGDIIYIQPSPNSYGSINITKPLSIYGIGNNPELNSGQNSTVVTISFGNASGSKISGLNINGITLTGQTVISHDVIITNNRINGSIVGNPLTNRANNVIISGNYLRKQNANLIDTHNSQNWVISNNIIEQLHTNATFATFNRFNASTILNNNIILSRQNGDGNQSIQVFFNCFGTQISNNIFLFTGNSVANMNLGGNSALAFNNNLTYSYNAVFDALSGTNNIDDTDPLFVAFNPNVALNTISNDFNLQGGSPAANAGTDGLDLGIYNGNFPFNIRGYPTELPYLTDFVIFNNIISAGTSLNVNVKANANNN